jgi:hypothetical protein
MRPSFSSRSSPSSPQSNGVDEGQVVLFAVVPQYDHVAIDASELVDAPRGVNHKQIVINLLNELALVALRRHFVRLARSIARRCWCWCSCCCFVIRFAVMITIFIWARHCCSLA